MVWMEREGVTIKEENRVWKALFLLYADDLVLCVESEESLSRLVDGFGSVFKKRGLKVYVDKRKMTVIGKYLKYLDCMWDEK